MLNPCAIFKLEPDSTVELLATGTTHTATYVVGKEVKAVGGDDAAMKRLNADRGYVVHGGDTEIAIAKADVIEMIQIETL